MKEVIKSLQEQISKKEQEVEDLKNDLKVLLKYAGSESATAGSSTFSVPKPIKRKQTFNSIILEALSDKVPKRASDLLEYYKEKTGKHNFKYNTFSARLSPMVNKDIKKHIRDGVPLPEKYWYGLPEMFNGVDLKPEYQIWDRQ